MKITCMKCKSTNLVGYGNTKAGTPRVKCNDCGKVFSPPKPKNPLGDMRLDLKKAADICRLLVEGMSVRSIERFTGVHRDADLAGKNDLSGSWPPPSP